MTRRANIDQRFRADTRSITSTAEGEAVANKLKDSVTTGLIAITADSAIASLKNDSKDNLIITSNIIQFFGIVGTGIIEVKITADPIEGSGLSDIAGRFNWNVGQTASPETTARKGSDGAAFTSAGEEVSGYIEVPQSAVANMEDFVLETGKTIGIEVILSGGSVTATTVVWSANAYHDDSQRVRGLVV